MEQNVQYIQTEFRRLVTQAVKEGLERIKPFVGDKYKLHTYFNWPTMSLSENGLPSFSETLFSGPINYTTAFGGKDSAVPHDSLESFQGLVSFADAHEYIKKRLLHPNMVKSREGDPNFNNWVMDYLKFMVHNIPEEIIDRYIHVNKSCDFSEESFTLIYEPLARCLFDEELFLDICIPILFLKFDFDQVELSPNTRLERMSDEFQLARAPLSAYGPGVHKSVLPAATHMLVLKNWHIKNHSVWLLSELVSDITAYPLDHIDNFFAALRIVTNFSTGYAQVLMRPRGWTHHYKTHLPPLEGTSIKAYPSSFENYYWLNKDIPIVNEEIAQEVGAIFLRLLDIIENSVHIAARRLNLCFLRDDDIDSILDATIGLEALLSDDNRQEMTHKLAMRVGALIKLAKSPQKSPYEVFQDVKKIYGYRSAVVHGSTDAHKRREIVSSDNRRIPVTPLAVDYLRMALHALIEYPQYRQPAKIDEELLLNNGLGQP